MALAPQHVRGRILPPSAIDPEVVQREQEKQRALGIYDAKAASSTGTNTARLRLAPYLLLSLYVRRRV